MNYLDLIILVCLGVGAVVGLTHGFAKELIGIMSIGLGIIGAKILSPMVASWLQAYVAMSDIVARLLSYVIIFVGIWAIGVMLGKLINKFLRDLSLGWLNRLLGAVFGAFKYTLALSLVLNLLALIEPKLPVIPEADRAAAQYYEPALALAGITWDKAQQILDTPGQQATTGVN